MRKYIFIVFCITATCGIALGETVRDFWHAKQLCIGSIQFTSKPKEYIAENIMVLEPEVPGSEFCVLVGDKEVFSPSGEMGRIEIQRQGGLEFGYFIPIFMDQIFPKVKVYAKPPNSVTELFSTGDTIFYNIIYEVKLSVDNILVSSKLVTKKRGEKIPSIEDKIRWQSGPFEVLWGEVLPEDLIIESTLSGDEEKRSRDKRERVRMDNAQLDSLCLFPHFRPPTNRRYETWERKPLSGGMYRLTWKKDMFSSSMEGGYFSSFFVKYIFPRIEAQVEIPSRYQGEEGYFLKYLSETKLGGVSVRPIITGLDEKWEGKSIMLPWDEALPEELKSEQ